MHGLKGFSAMSKTQHAGPQDYAGNPAVLNDEQIYAALLATYLLYLQSTVNFLEQIDEERFEMLSRQLCVI